jgi:predicted acylesterase/phospholipase RssA
MTNKSVSLVLGSGGARGLAHISVIHWLKNGSLFDAIRASISLPLFLKPFELNGTKLLDGGILNPVPIAPTFEDNTDRTFDAMQGAIARQKHAAHWSLTGLAR